MENYADLDATALSELVAKGEVSPAELVDHAIGEIERLNPKLNAVVHPMFEQARAQARGELPDGPFKGVPFLVKDLDGFLANEPYTMSSRFLRDFVPKHDAEVMARLKRAGLVILGKTNCPELGIVGTTEPEWRGPTHNPWNLDHTPGGSSGGSGAAVASRMVPMAHGGDGGGSIRIPASANGLFGMKTTRGRVPLGPDLGEGWGGYVQPGVLTRSVRDSARIVDALSGQAKGDPYFAPPVERPYAEEVTREPGKLRIAFSTRSIYGKLTEPECIAAVQDAAKLCQDLGHEVSEAHPPIDRDKLVMAYLVQMTASIAAELDEIAHWTGRPLDPACFEAVTWTLSLAGRKVSAVDLQNSRDTCHAAGRIMAAFHDDYDVFLTPTLAWLPAKLGEQAPKPVERVGMSLLRMLPVGAALRGLLAAMANDALERTPNTQLFNQTGQPAMSVPLYWTESGLPVGTQFVGRFGDEALLYRLAAQLEQARPWAQRKPAL